MGNAHQNTSGFPSLHLLSVDHSFRVFRCDQVNFPSLRVLCVPFLPGKNCQSLFSPKTLHFMAEPALSPMLHSFLILNFDFLPQMFVFLIDLETRLCRCLPKLFQILILIAVVSDISVSKDGWGGARMNREGLGTGGEQGQLGGQPGQLGGDPGQLGGDPGHLYQMFQVIWSNESLISNVSQYVNEYAWEGDIGLVKSLKI